MGGNLSMSIKIDGSKGIRQNTTETTQIPVGTTAQRPASPQAGMIRFNTDIGQVEGYNDVADRWQGVNEFFQQVVATGGTVTDITQNGALYRVHTFTSDGTFEVTRGGEVEHLVVAGGGGGASRHGGGGGAGGLVQGAISVSANQNYNIVVGNGGAGSSGGSQTIGDKGQDSTTAFGLIALGGGAGAGLSDFNSLQNGGSGGGSRGNSSVSGGTGEQPSSNSGGFGSDGGDTSGSGRGGGGGGATQVGAVGSSDAGSGKGGDGLDLTAFVGAGFGDGGFFAGGGSGGDSSNAPVPGGIGGGGTGGGDGGGATAGTNGTGGGGGGGGHSDFNRPGMAGGSGIVIVRYRIG